MPKINKKHKIIIQKALIFFFTFFLCVLLLQTQTVGFSELRSLIPISDLTLRVFGGLLLGAGGIYLLFKLDNKRSFNLDIPLISVYDFIRFSIFTIMYWVIMTLMMMLILGN